MNISIIFLGSFLAVCGLTLAIVYSQELGRALSARVKKWKGGRHG